MRREPRRFGVITAVAVAVAMAWAGGVGAAAAPTVPPTAPVPTAPVATSMPTATPAPAALAWGPCTAEAGIDPAFQCATLNVPLDYGAPAGPTIPMGVIRLPATSTRAGALLINPGGPGASGVDMAIDSADGIDSLLGLDGSFDIVGFDPRGVGRSAQISCDTESACVAEYGASYRLYSTENTARDMDLLRAAMGDQQITFYGASYGTYLGAVYAALFPDRVRAMALDAAWDPVEETPVDAWTTEFGGFEHALNRWIAWCQADTTCDLHGPDVGAQWDAIYELLEEQPISTAAGTIIDGSAVQSASYNAMYANWMWPILARGLADAAFGNGDILEELLGEGDAAESSAARATDDAATDDPEGAAMMAIRCASGIDLPHPDDPAATLAAVQAAAPRMSRGEGLSMFSEPDICDAIIGADVSPIVPVYAGAGPIVVIGGQNDPATPFRYAVEMSARLGPSTALLSYTGEGHAFLGSSSCVTGHISGVLRDLVLPPAGTVCDADPPIARPLFWDTLPVVAGVGDAVDPAVDYALPDAYGPWQAYADVRLLTGDPAAVFAAYQAALGAAGFSDLGTYDYDVGWSGVDFRAPDGTAMFVDVLTAEFVADLAFVDVLVPPGSALVIIGAYGTDPYS